MKKALHLVACLLGVISGSAQTVYEPFNYTASTILHGQSGGTGFSDTWNVTPGTGDFAAASSSLSYSGLMTSGNKLQATFHSSSNIATRTLSGSYGGSGNTLWIGFLYQWFSLNSYQSGLLFGGGGSYLLVGMEDGIQLGVSVDGGPGGVPMDSSTYVSFSPLTTYLLVVELNFTGAAAGNLNFYFNPTSAVSPGTPINGTPVAFSLGGTNTIGVWAGDSAQSLFDEIRLGPSYSDVFVAVPEPSVAAAVMGIMALGLTVRTARRRNGQ